MKVLRSKCKTRIIFDKQDSNISVRKVSEIDNIVLANGQIQFIGTNGNVLEAADWQAVDVPRTNTALEKVTHLTEWITCADTCSDCESADLFYDEELAQAGDIVFISSGAYANYLLSNLSFDFPDDLDCNSRFEVHYHACLRASGTRAEDNLVVDFFVDEARIDAARTAEVVVDAKWLYSVDSSFIIEGNKSGQTLTIGFANFNNATRSLVFSSQTLIIKRIK